MEEKTPSCSDLAFVSMSLSSFLLSLQDTEGFLAVDSEEYEVMPVEVKLLPRKLRFFCDARKKEQMLQGAS